MSTKNSTLKKDRQLTALAVLGDGTGRAAGGRRGRAGGRLGGGSWLGGSSRRRLGGSRADR